MAHTNWSVEYPVDPAASLTGPIPVGAKLLSSLTAALSEAPIEQWAFEIDGEPVDGYQTFQERLAAATDVRAGEYVARAGGLIVQSA